MKKLVCILLILVMSLSLSLMASASGIDRVSVEVMGEAAAGETMVFILSVTGTDMMDCMVEPSFDAQVFELKTVSWIAGVDDENVSDTGLAEARWDVPVDLDGELISFMLKVRSSAPTGSQTKVSWTVTATDSNGEPLIYTQAVESVFTVGCDHATFIQVEDEKYIKTPGTCEAPAEYYVSCADCGQAGEATFFGSAPGGHVFDAKVETEAYLSDPGDCQTKRSYYYSCSVCGEKGEETFVSAMKFGTHIYESPCDSDCDVCGKYREPEHTLAEEWSSDETGHWHICTECSEKVEFAEHVPGPEATAEEYQVCTVCQYVLAVSDEHAHEYSSEWSFDEKSHWHECTCGSKGDLEIHSWSLTETDRTDVLIAQCDVCGATKVEEVPALPEDETDPTPSASTRPTTQLPEPVRDEGVDALTVTLGILLALSLAGNGVLAWFAFGKKR